MHSHCNVSYGHLLYQYYLCLSSKMMYTIMSVNYRLAVIRLKAIYKFMEYIQKEIDKVY